MIHETENSMKKMSQTAQNQRSVLSLPEDNMSDKVSDSSQPAFNRTQRSSSWIYRGIRVSDSAEGNSKGGDESGVYH